VPALGLLLALVWLLGPPSRPAADAAPSQALAVTPREQADLQDKLRQLEMKDRLARPGDRPKSDQLKHLEAELDRLAHKPPRTRDEARELVKDMTAAEDQVRKRDNELAGRAQALKERVRQLDRLGGNKPSDGPAHRLEKALDEAAFKQAKEEAEKLGRQLDAGEQADRLRKKLRQPELTEEDKREAREQLKRLQGQELGREQREQLGKQMQAMEDKLERLTRSEEARERLRELRRQGLLDDDQLQRELDELARNDAALDPRTCDALRQVARKLAEARRALRQGKDGEAAQKLREAAELLDGLDDSAEVRALARQLRDLEQAREAVCDALEGKQGQAAGRKPGEGPPGPGGPARGRRPETKDGPTGAREEWAHSDFDRGQLQVIDQLPGEGFKGPRRPAEMAEDIRRAAQVLGGPADVLGHLRRAAQEAPEAIDRQRLPKSASDMARGYFEKLRTPR
jgi:hypothetical protein